MWCCDTVFASEQKKKIKKKHHEKDKDTTVESGLI